MLPPIPMVVLRGGIQRTTRAHAMAFEGSRVRGFGVREKVVGNLHHPRHCLVVSTGVGCGGRSALYSRFRCAGGLLSGPGPGG